MRESSRESDAPLARAMTLARDALAAEPAGLLTDFDGTLSPIVADPGLARLVEGADGALADLVDRLAVVAIVTGRAPLEARRLTGVPGLLVAGNHGMEWLEPDADEPTTSATGGRVHAAVRRVLARVPELDGVIVEDKGLSGSVHYRQSPDPADARGRILAALDDVGPELELRPGRMIVEVRPVGLGDKGAAARTIVERYGLRGAVVMGDDVTDLDMFAAVSELRGAGKLRAAIIGVGGADREVPQAVADAADVILASPEEAAVLLRALASP